MPRKLVRISSNTYASYCPRHKVAFQAIKTGTGYDVFRTDPGNNTQSLGWASSLSVAQSKVDKWRPSRKNGEDLESWLNGLSRIGVQWASPDGYKIYLHKKGVQLAQLTRQGGQWVIKYRSNGTVKAYKRKTLKGVENWLKADPLGGSKEAAACPLATQDLKTNTRNRNKSIQADHIQYGPLNLSDKGYWERLAKHWRTTPAVAKKSKCSNCVAFDISPRMQDCMPGMVQEDGYLGYCHMHHFKCHSARTCYTWASGGPITKDSVSLDWEKK